MNERTTRALCAAYGVLLGGRARYSRATEGNFAYMRLTDKLWWGYKQYIRQVELAEKGVGIEEHFAKENLRFTPPEGFIEHSAFTLSAGGDLMPSPYLSPKNVQHVWDEIAGWYFDADIVYANLESPITPAAISQTAAQTKATPSMNNSPEMLDIFLRGGKGVTLVSTANNHSMDTGEAGLVGTLNLLDQKGVAHTGAARTEAERDEPLVLEKNGVRVAFISCTFGLNGKETPSGKPYMVNYIRLNAPGTDLSLIERLIRRARLEKKADLVILLPHWSLEFELYPTKAVMGAARRLAALGADAIIGNHPHNVQPMERLRVADPFTGREKDCLVAYALGNLVNQTGFHGNWDLSLLAKLRLSKGELGGEPYACITDFAILPLYTFARHEGNAFVDQRLLDLRKTATSLHAGLIPCDMTASEKEQVLRMEQLMLRALGPALEATDASALKG